MLRALARFAAALGFLLAATSAAQGKPIIEVRGARIDFYAGQLALFARGGVDVRFPSGFHVHASSLYADLRADRYVMVGDVTVDGKGGRIRLAALSIDRMHQRAYALVLGEVATIRLITPQDLRGKVAPAPPSAFDFPDLDGIRPYIFTRHASVVPEVYVRFTPAYFPTSIGLTGPSPMYVYSFTSNPNFGATSLGPANFDQPYLLDGNATAASALHFRYVAGVGFQLGFDQHYVYGQNSFVVLSDSSIASKNAIYGLLAYQRIAPKLTQQLTANFGPFNSASYQITQGFKTSSLEFTTSNLTTATSADLIWKTYNLPLPLGFTYYVLGDFGFDQNSVGLYSSTQDPVKYDLIWRKTAQGYLATPLFRLPANVSANATITAERIWYAYPHRHDAVTLTSTASRRLNKQFNAVFTYTGNFTSDSYFNKQLLFFPPPTLPYYAPDGTPWPGYFAYSGAVSGRTYELDTYYTTGPGLNARLSYIRNVAFPQFHGYGPPEYTLAGDVRFQLGANLSIDIGRSYLFNWNRQVWSPQWSLTAIP